MQHSNYSGGNETEIFFSSFTLSTFKAGDTYDFLPTITECSYQSCKISITKLRNLKWLITLQHLTAEIAWNSLNSHYELSSNCRLMFRLKAAPLPLPSIRTTNGQNNVPHTKLKKEARIYLTIALLWWKMLSTSWWNPEVYYVARSGQCKWDNYNFKLVYSGQQTGQESRLNGLGLEECAY